MNSTNAHENNKNERVLLTVRNLTKRFGGLTAIATVSLDIPEQSIASIIGPNGAGKTTLFNCITGFYQPTEGEIIFEGRSITGLRPDQITARGIARTYQNIHLFKGMTALENILVGMHTRLSGGPISAVLRTSANQREEEEALAKAYELLNFVELTGFGDLLATNLPYGSQRRLEIARALASQPRLILLDEPTAGMNPREKEEMKAFIQRLRANRHLSVILIEHDMNVIMSISDQVSVLDFGEKIAEGTPEEVQANPKVIEAYLGTSDIQESAIRETVSSVGQNAEAEVENGTA